MHFPLSSHPLSEKASEAAECAGTNGQFWPMHDAFFADQSMLNPEDLIRKAEGLGIRRQRFQECLDGEMEAKVKRAAAEGKRLGVEVTPTFFLGRIDADGTIQISRKIVGAQPIDIFHKALAELDASNKKEN